MYLSLKSTPRVAPMLAALLVGLVVSTASETEVRAEPSELPPSMAYNYGEGETVRSVAMGGAMRALGNGLTGVMLNPAALGLTRQYHIEALGQFTPEAGRQVYGGGVVDTTRRFGGGVAVMGAFLDPDGIDRSYFDVRTATTFSLSKELHIGLTGRYLGLDQEGNGPLGDSRASGGLKDPDDAPDGRAALVETITFDVGMVFVPATGLHIGLLGQNLTFAGDGILPTVLGGGIGYGHEDFSIEADAVVDLHSYDEASPRISVGGEYLLMDAVPLRLGYRFDGLSGSGFQPSHAIAGGVGYVDPKFGIEAGLRRTVTGPQATTIVVQVALHLESLGIPLD